MMYYLIALIILLLVILGATLVLFHRQGKRLEEELQHAIDNEDIKSQHLKDVSVTFSDTLNKIILSCRNIESQPCICQNSDVAKAVEDIRFDSQQLAQYANEILEVSNTQGNIPHSKKIQVNLIELIMSYRREIMYDVKDNVQVNLHTDLSSQTKFWVDTTIFRQLVMHILRYAARATTHGSINIRYAAEDQGLRFWFENTTDSVPNDSIKTLLSSKTDLSSLDNIECDKDTIMSMSLCKSIITTLKGNIEASSQQTDTNYLNTITFWIPCIFGEE